MVSNVHSKTTDDNRYTATSWLYPSSIIGDVYSNTPLSPLHSWRHAHIEHIRGQLVDTDISRREHHSSAQQGIKNIKWIYPIGSPINLLFDSISGKSLEYFPLDATLEYFLQETFLCIAFD